MYRVQLLTRLSDSDYLLSMSICNEGNPKGKDKAKLNYKATKPNRPKRQV